MKLKARNSYMWNFFLAQLVKRNKWAYHCPSTLRVAFCALYFFSKRLTCRGTNNFSFYPTEGIVKFEAFQYGVGNLQMNSYSSQYTRCRYVAIL